MNNTKKKILVGVNLGFITNSSSVVHHFPSELLEHPKVKSFMEAMGITSGYVGDDMWYRSSCESVAVTADQKKEIQEGLASMEDYEVPSIEVEDPNTFVIVYGDEYEGAAQTLAFMLSVIANEMGLEHYYEDYN